MSEYIFERKIDQTYENCKGAVGIADDVQAFGNEKIHDRTFPGGDRMHGKTGIKHNFDKCIIKTKCCSYLVAYIIQKESNLT